jgi:hypothetical protein
VGVEEVEVPDSLYADDTGELFLSRADLQTDVPELIKLFAKFGLFVHVGTKEKKSKSVIVYHAAPRACYNDYSTFDGADFSDVDLGSGATMHIEESAKYLGSIIHRDGTDTADVDARIRSAKGAFGALRQCLFARKDVTLEGKRAVYTALILYPLCTSLRQRVVGAHRGAVGEAPGVPRTVCAWDVQGEPLAHAQVQDKYEGALGPAGAGEYRHIRC